MNTNGVRLEEAIAIESIHLYLVIKFYLIPELIFVEAIYFVGNLCFLEELHYVKKVNSTMELNLVVVLYLVELEIKTCKNMEIYFSIKINIVKGLSLLEL